MAARGVVVNDLFASAQPRLTELQRPFDVHFTKAGNRQLAEDVARCVRAALGANEAK